MGLDHRHWLRDALRFDVDRVARDAAVLRIQPTGPRDVGLWDAVFASTHNIKGIDMMLTINGDYFTAVHQFVATKDVWFYLKGVCIDTGPHGAFIVGCHGASLAVALVSGDALPVARFILDASACDMIAKMRPTMIDIDMTGIVGDYQGGERRTVTVRTYGKTQTSLQVSEIDGIYPSWRKVAKHAGDAYLTSHAMYDPALVTRVQKAGAIIKGSKAMTLIRPGGKTGCGFAQLDNDGLCCAWIMGLRGDIADLPSAPAFVIGE